jgi:hypothetical protein
LTQEDSYLGVNLSMWTSSTNFKFSILPLIVINLGVFENTYRFNDEHHYCYGKRITGDVPDLALI